MRNNIVPLSQQANSRSKKGLSFTGDDHFQSTRPNLTGSTEHPAVISEPDAATIEGSEKNPSLSDSIPRRTFPSGTTTEDV